MQFFYDLSSDDAVKYLNNFVEKAEEGLLTMEQQLNESDIVLDYTLQSVSQLILWISEQLNTVPRAPDASLPDWIRTSSTYVEGLFSFDEFSNILVLRASYYLGETFVRSSDSLTWSIGAPDTAEEKMPVVTGFKHSMELAPLMVMENILRRITKGGDSKNNVDTMINTWTNFIK